MKTITSALFSLFFLFSLSLLAEPDTVEMQDNVFVPDSITISEGDTIVWVNTGSNDHTSTSGTGCTEDGIWNSGSVGSGGSFMFEFSAAGEYPYYCIPHCALGMTGHVTVEGQPSGTKDVVASSAISVYPNPVNDQLQVDLSNVDGSRLQVNITDLSGRKVISKSPVKEGNKLVVDTSPLQQGMYVVSMLVDGKTVAVEKISKL